MSSFELQTYKSGNWIVDSYYDDRDLAISEAERLSISGRHSGIRVLEEEYHEPTNTSNYSVIFSKMYKDSVKKTAPSKSGRSASRPAPGAATGTPRAARRPPPKAATGGSGVMVPVLAAVVLLIAGVAAMMALQSDMDIGATLNSLVGSKPK